MRSMFGVALICLVGLASSLPNRKNVVHFQQQEEFQVNVSNSTCMDAKYFCSQNRTCCQSNGTIPFACCPYPQGICCLDKIHCCPRGSVCSIPKKGCIRSEDGTQLLPETFSEMNPPRRLSENAVVCPGGEQECADGQTCCSNNSGGYKCCMYPNAVCCTDGKHCCPANYTCDLSAGLCRHPVFTGMASLAFEPITLN